jgi:hypothetical protein
LLTLLARLIWLTLLALLVLLTRLDWLARLDCLSLLILLGLRASLLLELRLRLGLRLGRLILPGLLLPGLLRRSLLHRLALRRFLYLLWSWLILLRLALLLSLWRGTLLLLSRLWRPGLPLLVFYRPTAFVATFFALTLLSLVFGPRLLFPGGRRFIPGRFVWSACFTGFSGINGLLIENLIDKILFFQEFCSLDVEHFCYFPKFGNKHLAQF